MTIHRSYQNDGSSTYLVPFTPIMWILTFLTILLCFITFHLTNYINNSFTQDDSQFNWSLTLMVILHGFLGQGAPYEPKSYSTRVVFYVVFSSGLILYTGYSACLTSFLTVKHIKFPFTDFQQFYEQTNFKLISVRGTYYEDIFKYGTPLQRKIYNERMVFSDSVAEGVKMLEKDQKLAIYWTDAISQLFSDECQFTSIPHFDFRLPMSIGAIKNSSYIDIFNYQIQKMWENGRLDQLQRKWLETDWICEAPKNEGLGMDLVYTLFILMVSSIGLSFVLLLVEIIAEKIGRKYSL